jgi:hypothetical protein
MRFRVRSSTEALFTKPGRHNNSSGMRNVRKAVTKGRMELGQYIIVDPEICHGKPTFKGTRIMVWQVLDALARGGIRVRNC